MNPRISRVATVCTAALCTFVYACVLSEETSTGQQAAENLNGSNLNGSNLNGSNLNGMSLLGFLVEGATKESVALTNVRVDKGELIAEQNAVTLRGSAMAGAQLQAQARNLNAEPPTSAIVTYRITEVIPEVAGYDPTSTGSTFLYTIEQWNETTTSWVTACPADFDGRHVAIPVAAEWDETGVRTDASTMFTLACTSGVIAKCYRWGYRPWVTGYGDLTTMHWACTRLARADFCGNGVSYTTDGTLIDVWDILPVAGPDPASRDDVRDGVRFGMEHRRGDVSERCALDQERIGDHRDVSGEADSAGPGWDRLQLRGERDPAGPVDADVQGVVHRPLIVEAGAPPVPARAASARGRARSARPGRRTRGTAGRSRASRRPRPRR